MTASGAFITCLHAADNGTNLLRWIWRATSCVCSSLSRLQSLLQSRWRVKCSHRLVEFVQAASVNLNRCLTPAPIDGRPGLCEIRQPKAWPHIDCSNLRELSLNVAGQVSRARPAPAPNRQTHRATQSAKNGHNCNSSVDSDTSEQFVPQTDHRSSN